MQFLSWIPAGNLPFPDPKIIGKSLAWYPVIGLFIGLFLLAEAFVATWLFNSWISAALVLAAWVGLTGALHLDGLADSADAWLGGLGSKTRTLKIMKDPTSGPIAISVLVLVLLLKFVCLAALLAANQTSTLIWALIFARANAVLLLMHTPYAREQGLASALQSNYSKEACYGVIAVLGLLSLLILSWPALVVCSVTAASLYLLRQIMLDRLNGCTGDTLGALIELSEVFILLSLVACLTSP